MSTGTGFLTIQKHFKNRRSDFFLCLKFDFRKTTKKVANRSDCFRIEFRFLFVIPKVLTHKKSKCYRL